MASVYRFERFRLDPADRRLSRDGVPVELNARYLDALALLVREAGALVSKDRFMDEVWRGVPVTDEALTQCIRTLRRQLGDAAASPRFIETVPKHGYRFVAAVAGEEGAGGGAPAAAAASPWRRLLLLGGAGTIGGGAAGLAGGIFYGFVGASQPGAGAVSVLLVLLWLTLAAALTGAAGVAFGIAAAAAAGRGAWTVAGGALGGLAVGASAKLLGLDAFNLLLGRSPGDVTGGPEGLLLGAAVGLGAWLGARRGWSPRRAAAAAAAIGAAAGALVPLAGGRLMGGSLDLLARSFPGSRLRLDPLGAAFGESGFGPVSQVVTGALEGALFGGCVVGAMLAARRSLGEGDSHW
ncbi:MAG: hypothetical protein QOI38_1125 [Sphingomonadales bacterium]|jgi:DNA-binding winged helix-turn-helix (wHTH) protein|nr:hypothetical protein [Sphingomonadales bacterium]